MVEKIEQLRKEIDKIDIELIELLNKRLKLSLKIGELKKEKKLQVYSPERENIILRNLEKLNKGPFKTKSLKRIYREIFSEALSLQTPLKVAYLGPPASFTHIALIKAFGNSVSSLPANSIKDIFTFVDSGQVDFGVVPIENSTEGIITHTLDMFLDFDLKIVNEIFLEISHCLLSKSKDIKKIKKIYSHSQAIGQCRIWLNTNFPSIPIIETASTSSAASLASKDKKAAAIASELAAEVYGLNILSKKIEDVSENLTRFLVIANLPNFPEKSGFDKTSVICSVKDRPGALYKLLEPMALNKVNMTKIESRPTKKKPWEYVFFIDMQGYISDKKIKIVIEKLKKECMFFKILGSYPVAAD